MENGRPLVLEIDPANQNPQILRSNVYINPFKRLAVGKQAIDRYLADINNLPDKPPVRAATGRMIRMIKEAGISGFAGTKMVPEIVEVDTSGRGRLIQALKTVLAHEHFQGTEISFYDGEEVNQTRYSIEQLLSIILHDIKIRAEQATGTDFDQVVLGRPIRYVGKSAHEAVALARMKTVAQEVGFKRVEFEYEPVGAALNFSLDIAKRSNLLIFDFGGGTLDICIMRLPEKEILAVGGLAVGGDLLNSKIFQEKLAKYFGSQTTFMQGKGAIPSHLLSAMNNWYAMSQLKTMKSLQSLDNLIGLADDPQPIEALKELILSDRGFSLYQEIDRAKIGLSFHDQEDIAFSGKSYEIKENLSRAAFENMIQGYVEETRDCINQVLGQARFSPAQIDEVITTGGSSSIPLFLKLLTDMFGKNKVVVGESFTAVAAGLAIRAQQIFG